MKQYQIVLVNLDPTLGSEINKTRPGVIVSPDEMNNNLQTIIICPITSKSKAYPTRVPFTNDKGEINFIAVDQVRTIDKQRTGKILGSLDSDTVAKLKKTLELTFVA